MYLVSPARDISSWPMRNCHHPDLSLFASVLYWFKTSPLFLSLSLSKNVPSPMCAICLCFCRGCLSCFVIPLLLLNQPTLLGRKVYSKGQPWHYFIGMGALEMCMSSKSHTRMFVAVPFQEHPQLDKYTEIYSSKEHTQRQRTTRKLRLNLIDVTLSERSQAQYPSFPKNKPSSSEGCVCM